MRMGGTSSQIARFYAMTDDPKTRRSEAPQDEKISPAGTHDKPELTDHHKTPGSGMLPDADEDHEEVEGPTG